uniref:MAK10-like protein n=1 Tax=Tanacetum cinerariifolium TaxID=118510 RepID=A0A6L2MM30_TANCI|nr:hypothetical protein [Tanacetum cinerariifolium]
MGDENPIRTLGDYSKPSHEGYRNTIELPEGNNVVPHRSDTIRLVQNGCSFHELRSEDPNQHLKDFLKLVDSLNLNGSISTREDLTTHFLAEFFPPRRTTKLRNDILMRDIRLVCNFMASQDARLSKFETDFKQQQSEMTKTINTVLKAITDRITRTISSDMVKNLKLNVNSTFLVLSARSYPMEDPIAHLILLIQSMLSKSVPKRETILEQTLEDEFKDLHLNLLVLEILAHAPMYNAILDKYVESLELGENGFAFIQGKMPKRMEDPGLFTLPCRLGDSKPFDALADLGACMNIILLYLFKKLNVGLLEETDHVFGLADGTKSYPVGIIRDVEVHIGRLKLLNDFYVIDVKKDPKTPLLVGRGFLAIANAVIDCRKAKIAVGEWITRSVFGVKGSELVKRKHHIGPH